MTPNDSTEPATAQAPAFQTKCRAVGRKALAALLAIFKPINGSMARESKFGVHHAPDAIEATDGALLLRIPLADDARGAHVDFTGGVSVRDALIRKAVDGNRGSVRMHRATVIDCDVRGHADLDEPESQHPNRFPNIDGIIPPPEAIKFRFTLSGAVLMKLATAACRLDLALGAVTFEFQSLGDASAPKKGGHPPIGVKVGDDVRAHLTGAVMPTTFHVAGIGQ